MNPTSCTQPSNYQTLKSSSLLCLCLTPASTEMAVICIELLQSEAALLDIKLLGKSKGHAFYVLH